MPVPGDAEAAESGTCAGDHALTTQAARGGERGGRSAALLEAAPAIKYKAALGVAYGAGLCVSEVAHLKVDDIDSAHMLIRVEQEGRKDRNAMLSLQLWELLRTCIDKFVIAKLIAYCPIFAGHELSVRSCVNDRSGAPLPNDYELFMEYQNLAETLGLPVGDLFKILTDAAPGFVWVADHRGNVTYANKSWCGFTGFTIDASLRHGWLDALHPDDADKIRKLLDTPRPGFSNFEMAVQYRRYDDVYFWHMVRACPIPSAPGFWIGCAVEIHNQAISREKADAQVRILEMVASGAAIHDILAALCIYAENILPGAKCSILLVDAEEGVFTGGVAPTLPPIMTEALAGIGIGTGVGSCGTAASERRDVIVSDIATDPLWLDWRELAHSNGLRACWSRPVFSSTGVVLATFAFYFAEKRSPTSDETSQMEGITHIASFALEHSHTASALSESEEHYRHSVELNPQIPWTADPDGNVLSVSSRWTALTGLTQQEGLGSGWGRSIHPEDVEATLAQWHECLSSGGIEDFQYRMRLRDGSYRWVRARAAPRRDEQGNIVRWYGTLEDVHEHRLAEDALRRAAYVDDLTGLPNRRHFDEELQQALRSRGQNQGVVGLLVLDMDDFKQVNSRFGRAAGDAVLRLFSRHLRKLMMPTEFAARLGGDEFGVILKAVDDEREVQARAMQLMASLDTYLKRSVRARNCHASVGGAVSTPGDSADELFKKASLALYSLRKTKQRAVKLFTPEIGIRNRQKIDQIELAREALRFGWIIPYYQPKISLLDDRIVGLEALIRISHPEEGILPPARILAALDHPHVGSELGERMMSLVIQDLKAWRANGTVVGHVALNLSAEHLTRPDFADHLLADLQQARLASDSLKLEITERVLIEELSGDIRDALVRLQETGVGISLDDFGTGYASLTHLQYFPVNEIKIDRSFVDRLAGDAGNAAIVKAMIQLGRSLDVDFR
ncbi:EAL domain-containing protein [Mesorhizobium sp. PUT5]|uniref:EAL domain-containing protein n=1 Tax=Mesorhizobium sp. PUT5 TaxID=3454629 RepID=UPI003FA4B102